MDVHNGQSRNMLLRRLPPAEWTVLAPHLRGHVLERGAILCAAGARIPHAIFPISGIVTLTATTDEGAVVLGGMVGRDGMFGLPLSAGLRTSAVAACVAGSGEAVGIDSRRFCQLLQRCPVLALRIHRATLGMMDQLTQIVVCNGHHSVEERAARWILSTSDRMQSARISLKQSSLAGMLGVLRPSVSQAASALRAAGLVDYRRGEIEIVDRERLQTRACSCYATAARTYARSLR